MELTPGRSVDRYTVLGPLGAGGTASVYLARHAALGTLHALKILTAPALAIRQRLLQEGRIQARLRHPNIVPVTEVVECAGCPGLVMEYVDGPTLARFLAQARPTPAQIDDLASALLAGVAAAHAVGLAHRDLKPSNILLAIEGARVIPRIADFGLAKLLDAGPDGDDLTGSGVAMGTPAYMAPEQIRDARAADARADIWALEASDPTINWDWTEDDSPAPTPAPSNPFDYWTPARSPRLVGRGLALRELERALGQGRSLSVVGDRRVGKTSLLESWAAALERRGARVPAIDGQRGAGRSVGAWVAAITGREAPEDADGAAEVLADWTREGSGGPPVILMDEADGPVAEFPYRFWERVRGMLERAVFVWATRQDLDRIYEETGRGSPFGNRLGLLRLGLIDAEGAAILIGWGAPPLDGDDRALMASWCGRHPYYLQLLGHCLVEAKLRGAAQSEAMDRFLDTADARLRTLWRTLSPREKQALRACAGGAPGRLRRLRWRGLIDERGQLFGRVLSDWMEQEA